jgi:hypothetical protein
MHNSIPFADPEWNAQPIAEKVMRANTWLESNSDHSSYTIVRHATDGLLATIALTTELTETRTELTETRTVLTETRTVLTETRTELTETKTELTETKTKLKNRSLQSLLQKFTALVDCSLSEPHFSSRHKQAKVFDNILGERLLAWADALLTPDFLSVQFMEVQSTNCDSENKAQTLVVHLLESALSALKVNKFVEVVANRTLAGVECDVLLSYKPNRLPFGTLEVKKPGSTAEQRRLVFFGDKSIGGNVVAGQIYDQMMAIKLFGFENVVGMITTWNHWRLVSTNSSEEGNDLDSFTKQSVNERFNELQHVPVAAQNVTENQENESPPLVPATFDGQDPAKIKRQIFASQIVPDLMLSDKKNPNYEESLELIIQNSGRRILQMVTIFVVKACRNLTEFLADHNRPLTSIRVHKRMACRIMVKGKSRTFSFGTVPIRGCVPSKYISEGAKIHVVHHLGSGENGGVCFGVPRGGFSCCAVKFYHLLEQSNELAKKEFENWQKVYGNRAWSLPMSRVFKAGGGSCLVMPYVRPVDKNARQALLDEGKIEAALTRFAWTGCTHRDVKWRHLGWWNDEIFLIDLGDIKEDQSPLQVKKWIFDSLRKLRESAVKMQAKTPQKEISESKRIDLGDINEDQISPLLTEEWFSDSLTTPYESAINKQAKSPKRNVSGRKRRRL